jgi:hypothetical protein
VRPVCKTAREASSTLLNLGALEGRIDMIARDPRATWKYVLVKDRALPREQQTVFNLKHLSLRAEQEAYDGIERTKDGSVVMDTGSRSLKCLREGLAGWDNLLDEKGAPVDATKNALGQVDDVSLMRLEIEDRMELAGAIENEIAYDPDTVGKSVPPST